VIGGDGAVYVGSADGGFHALNPDGTRRWRFETRGIIDSAAVIGRYDPALGTSPITVGSGDERLHHLRSDPQDLPAARRVIWTHRADQRSTTGQRVNWWEGNVEAGADGTLFAGNTGGSAYAVHPDGTAKWVFPTGNSVWTSAAIGDDGTTHWGSLDLSVHAVDAAGTERWKTGTLGFVVSSPALARGSLQPNAGSRRICHRMRRCSARRHTPENKEKR